MGGRGEHRSEILSSWALPFREARKRLGKTIADISADTGLANQTINKILKGDESVLVRHIQRLAAYFGFEVTAAVKLQEVGGKTKTEDEIRAEIERLYEERNRYLRADMAAVMTVASVEGRIAALQWVIGERSSTVRDS